MPAWWDEMAAAVEATGADRHSAEWYAAMRDEYGRRFPDADARSVENMRMMAEWAVDFSTQHTVESSTSGRDNQGRPK